MNRHEPKHRIERDPLEDNLGAALARTLGRYGIHGYITGMQSDGSYISVETVITDDNGHVIPTEALDRIGSDLEHLYDTLDARDLSAGSPQARRLFS